MRVQYLLIAASFLEDITEPLVGIRRRLCAFMRMAESKRSRLRVCRFGIRFAAMPTGHRSIPKRYWTSGRDDVMLSHTMEEIRACIPFGAAHRVNFDTP